MRAAVEGHDIWAKARAGVRLPAVPPHLEHPVELRRRYIACFEGFDEPYDVLLDDFEPG